MPAKKPRSEILEAARRATSDEVAAVEFLEAQRWGDCPACVHCGDMDVYKMQQRGTGERDKRFRWRCRGCKRQYTVKVGTVMADSPIPARHWVLTMWMMAASKKGVSSKQIERMTGLSYKSALFLTHRVRYAMADDTGSALSGTVEVDEVYIGGKPRKANRKEDRVPAKRGKGADKQPVVAMVERKGRVRARVVANVTAANLGEALADCVHPSACIVTDELNVYPKATRGHAAHKAVRHQTGEYVRYEEDGFAVHTNTAEGFFSLVRRSLIGTYHAVSRKHLHRYMSEREFLYNTRGVDDGERLATAIRKAEGKKLANRNSSPL